VYCLLEVLRVLSAKHSDWNLLSLIGTHLFICCRHDDDPAGDIHCQVGSDCGYAGGDNGYSDELDCGIRIHASAGATVNLHFTQMNLEGGKHIKSLSFDK
jgi:hypothetical protein